MPRAPKIHQADSRSCWRSRDLLAVNACPSRIPPTRDGISATRIACMRASLCKYLALCIRMPFGIGFDTNVHMYICSSTDSVGPWRPSLFEKHSSNPVSQMERCYTTSQTGNGNYHYQHRQPSKSKADFERLQQRATEQFSHNARDEICPCSKGKRSW